MARYRVNWPFHILIDFFWIILIAGINAIKFLIMKVKALSSQLFCISVILLQLFLYVLRSSEDFVMQFRAV
jgi:hypothetical protein